MTRHRGWVAALLLAWLPFVHAQPQVVHTVLEGDTLIGIAEQYLGDPSLWRELLRVNPSIRNDRRLRVGSEVVVPLPVPGPVAVHVNGKASFTRLGEVRALTPGTRLQERDSVEVQEASYVTLRWPEGMVTHLLPGSSLKLVRPVGTGGERPHVLELNKGTAESRVPQGAGGVPFQVRTRLGTAAVRGTGFGVRLGDSMITDVTEGSVGLAGQGFQPLELPAGSGAVAGASRRQPNAVPLLPAPQLQVDAFISADSEVRAPEVAGAVRYEFELAPAQSPDATLRRASSDTPVFALQPLQEGAWRVRMRAIDPQGIPDMPATRIVAVVVFPPPVPVTPPNEGRVVEGAPARLECSSAPRATSYDIEIHSLDAQREPVRITVAPLCSAALPQLPPGRYRWRASASREIPGARPLRSQPGPWSHFSVVPR